MATLLRHGVLQWGAWQGSLAHAWSAYNHALAAEPLITKCITGTAFHAFAAAGPPSSRCGCQATHKQRLQESTTARGMRPASGGGQCIHALGVRDTHASCLLGSHPQGLWGRSLETSLHRQAVGVPALLNRMGLHDQRAACALWSSHPCRSWSSPPGTRCVPAACLAMAISQWHCWELPILSCSCSTCWHGRGCRSARTTCSSARWLPRSCTRRPTAASRTAAMPTYVPKRHTGKLHHRVYGIRKLHCG